MASFKALYGRPLCTLSCWLDTGDLVLADLHLVEEIVKQVELIKKRMKKAQDRQKSYVNIHRRIVEFEIGEYVFLKISPIKGGMRFVKSNKLGSRYVGPF